MPSSPVRRSPRAAGPSWRAAPTQPQRPLAVPFAATFGLLVAAEDGYLAWLLWEPDAGLEWFVAAPLALALVALAGAGLLLLGRRWAWLLLILSSALLLVVLLLVAVLFGALGGGSALWSALLLLVGPVGCLVLAVRRDVRRWRGRSAARRSAGGARRTGRSR